MILRIVLGIVCAAALAVTSASAQQKRVRGTIEQVDGPGVDHQVAGRRHVESEDGRRRQGRGSG